MESYQIKMKTKKLEKWESNLFDKREKEKNNITGINFLLSIIDNEIRKLIRKDNEILENISLEVQKDIEKKKNSMYINQSNIYFPD